MTSQSDQSARRFVLHVDYGDQLLLSKEQGDYYGRLRMAKLFERAVGSGITDIFWRVSMIGAANWPSKVRYQLHDPRASQIALNEPSVHPFTTIGEQYEQVLKEGDPLGMAAELAHENGLRFYAYVTLFDESYPGAESRYIKENPQHCWQHRYLAHKTIPGLLSYAEPQVVEYRLAELTELLGYNIDGIYYDTARTHCGVWDIYPVPFGNYSPYWSYGFNPLECAAFESQYGFSPRLNNLADAVLPEQLAVIHDGRWDRLRGEYLTAYLALASEKIKAANKRLAVGFYTDADSYLSPAGQRGRAPMGRFHHDWQTWWEQRLIDELVVVAGDHRRFGTDDWINHSSAQFAAARQEGLAVFLWAGTEHRIDELPSAVDGTVPLSIGDDRDAFLSKMEQSLQVTCQQDAEGLFLHEAWDIEQYNYFDTIKRALQQ